VIRFAEIFHQVKFSQALALLNQWRGLEPILHEATGFYRPPVTPSCQSGGLAAATRTPTPELIEHMRIGYAPGGDACGAG